MDIQGALIRHVTYPLWLRRFGLHATLAMERRLRKLEAASPAELLDLQRESLVQILRVASQKTSYYARLFGEYGVRPEDGVAGLRRLPRLTKQVIRSTPAEHLINRDIPASDLFPASTGGSTGLPMTFHRSRSCLTMRRAQDSILDGWIGLRAGDAVGLFVAASHHVAGNAWKDELRNATFDRLLRCDPSRLDDEYLADYHRRLIRFRPRFLKCFPSSLAVYARFLRKHGLTPPRVEGITATGETLHDWQRSAFESTFDAPVYERYGTKESGLIAGQCRCRGGMHVFLPGAFVEIVRPDGVDCAPGEQGSILVTDLFNDGMPLVRYEIGDLAVQGDAGSCSCGLPYPRLERILGRDRDLVIDARGGARPGYLFVEVINGANLDVQFQIHQEIEGEIEVRILRQDRPGPPEIQSIVDKFTELMQGGVVRLVQVDELPRDPSGKYPYVVSAPGRRFQLVSSTPPG